MSKNTNRKKITGGIYLVLDPSIGKKELLEKLDEALEGRADVIQIWNHWPDSISYDDKTRLIEDILQRTSGFKVPVLINEEWELLKTTALDGVHFDKIPEDLERIESEISRDFIAGITCSNDLDLIRWADQNDFDYVSFCSMFPSSSVDSCEIVRPDTVRKAREITDLPLFVSGGITIENLPDLEGLDFQGVAVISGILNSDSPKESAIEYRQVLNEKVPFRRVKERRSRSGG